MLTLGGSRQASRLQCGQRRRGLGQPALHALGLVTALASQGAEALAQDVERFVLRGFEQTAAQRLPVAVQRHQLVGGQQRCVGQGLCVGDQAVGLGARFPRGNSGFVALLGQAVDLSVVLAKRALGLLQCVFRSQRFNRCQLEREHRRFLRKGQQRGIVAQRVLQARRPAGLVLFGLLELALRLQRGLLCARRRRLLFSGAGRLALRCVLGG